MVPDVKPVDQPLERTNNGYNRNEEWYNAQIAELDEGVRKSARALSEIVPDNKSYSGVVPDDKPVDVLSDRNDDGYDSDEEWYNAQISERDEGA